MRAAMLHDCECGRDCACACACACDCARSGGRQVCTQSALICGYTPERVVLDQEADTYAPKGH
eukprot:1155595-Pelagomonas_calceolata.AAC.2